MKERSGRLVRVTLLTFLVLAVLILLLYSFLDRPLVEAARQLQHSPWHLWATRLSLLADVTVVFFVIAIGLTIHALHCVGKGQGHPVSPWARDVAFVCLAGCVGIVFVESVKVVFGRCRPELWFEQELYGFSWWSRDYLRNSFPSGHCTRIFALATALALVCRKATAPALALALLVGVSRVLALKHYPSDVLAGAWLGSVSAFWVWYLWKRESRDAHCRGSFLFVATRLPPCPGPLPAASSRKSSMSRPVTRPTKRPTSRPWRMKRIVGKEAMLYFTRCGSQ